MLQKGEAKQAYNVANEASHLTIKAMAEMVQQKFGAPGAKVVIDIPTVGLKESYARLIQWLKEQASE